MPLLLLILIVVPILEIYLLISVGQRIGVVSTIGLVILTAILGGWLLQQQGISTLNRYQSSMSRGQMPAMELMEGVMLLVGGVLLLTPGFFTDGIGFLLLLPWSRQAIARYLLSRAQMQMHQQHPSSHQPGQRTFDGDYQEVKDDNERLR